MSAAVSLSSGEVCWTIQREIDHATDETRPGLLVAYKAMLELATHRAPMASVAIGDGELGRANCHCVCTKCVAQTTVHSICEYGCDLRRREAKTSETPPTTSERPSDSGPSGDPAGTANAAAPSPGGVPKSPGAIPRTSEAKHAPNCGYGMLEDSDWQDCTCHVHAARKAKRSGAKTDCENCHGTGKWHDIVFDEERQCPCVNGEAMKLPRTKEAKADATCSTCGKSYVYWAGKACTCGREQRPNDGVVWADHWNAPMASVAIGVWNVARDPEEPCVTPVKWVDREELREMYKPHLDAGAPADNTDSHGEQESVGAEREGVGAQHGGGEAPARAGLSGGSVGVRGGSACDAGQGGRRGDDADLPAERGRPVKEDGPGDLRGVRGDGPRAAAGELTHQGHVCDECVGEPSTYKCPRTSDGMVCVCGHHQGSHAACGKENCYVPSCRCEKFTPRTKEPWVPKFGDRVVTTDQVLVEYRGCSGKIVDIHDVHGHDLEFLVMLDQHDNKHVWWHAKFLRPEPQRPNKPMVRCWRCKHEVPESTTVCNAGVGTQCKDSKACRGRWYGEHPRTDSARTCEDCEDAPAILCRSCVKHACEVAVDHLVDSEGREHCWGCLRGDRRKCPGMPRTEPAVATLKDVPLDEREEFWNKAWNAAIDNAAKQADADNCWGTADRIRKLTAQPACSETALPSVLAGNDAAFERLRIVSWLRRMAEGSSSARVINTLAEQIDIGVHMPDESTPTGSDGA